MTHDASVGTRHVEQHRIKNLGKRVLFEQPFLLRLHEVTLNESHVSTLCSRQVLFQPVDARTGQVDRHHAARTH